MSAPGSPRKMDEADPRRARVLGLAILPLLLGLLFFAASLTPSLIPRPWLLQGVLAGLVTAIGYAIGQFLNTVWRALELPTLSMPAVRKLSLFLAIPVIGLLVWTLLHAAEWQNSIRLRFEMEPLEAFSTYGIIGVATATFLVSVALGWAAQFLFDRIRRALYRIMPMRTANVLGLALAILIGFVITRDAVIRSGFDLADKSYATAQNLFADAPPAPQDTRFPGSPGSHVDWGAMGQPGRNFVVDGPDAAAISAFTGRAAMNPIRVYVGRAQSESPQVRAELALQELIRLGAFDRKVLIVASPTGTGWLDPGGHEPMEFMHDGDVATVAVQYSYLQSPLALIFETQSGLEQATATMQAIYRHWTTLPPDARPRFYMHGISLGAWSSMYSFNVFSILNDPIDGALWTGPPFPSRLWNQAVVARNPGSPYVLPEVGSGRLVRFASQYGGLERTSGPWGRLRVVYLQHASDAIVFYEPTSVWRAPEWMKEPRAPDVSPAIRFIPVVTQLQLALDMALALGVPGGYGHNYIAEDYIDPWVAVTDPEGWTDDDSTRLKAWCAQEWGQGCRRE
ncbi:putative membrane protein [Aliiruegeria haliotis]|uniref:Putative membrane protein n=1 Tax=Aliiruegeria haliotis TaxID=1280846 RepID=A0A2T0S020_9RHOB|nr:alpha/beta-hydrolase family protein [Aliiruegeria haliotis]PRY26778.1 putative membrane protein [Aliiruegeria haliotis]